MAGLSNVWVDAYEPDGARLKSAISDTGGAYTVAGLPAGFYFVRTDALGFNHVDEWYDDIPVSGSTIPATATATF